MVRTSIVLKQETIDWIIEEARKDNRSFAYKVREKLESLRKCSPGKPKQKR
jgi:hypothetical protein